MTSKVGDIRPVREGLFLNIDQSLDQVRLAGSQCSQCGEVTLGSVSHCPNCGSDKLTEIALSERGSLWTYTVARHKPPGDYRGPEPFEPYGIGLVELPEGLRVVTRIDGDIDEMEIGKPMVFNPGLRHDPDGSLVITFGFRFDDEAVS